MLSPMNIRFHLRLNLRLFYIVVSDRRQIVKLLYISFFLTKNTYSEPVSKAIAFLIFSNNLPSKGFLE